MDGVTVADVRAYGVERWVGKLSRDPGASTYANHVPSGAV